MKGPLYAADRTTHRRIVRQRISLRLVTLAGLGARGSGSGVRWNVQSGAAHNKLDARWRGTNTITATFRNATRVAGASYA
jgi:hypothetical protein